MSNRCRYMTQHLSTFIHYPLDSHSPTMLWGTKQSGACASKSPLPVRHTTSLEASMQTWQICHFSQKPCSDCIYIIYLYINNYMGKRKSWEKENMGVEGQNKKNKKQKKTWSSPNCYSLIMQVWGWARDQQTEGRLTVLERYHTKSLHRKRWLCKKGHRVTR